MGSLVRALVVAGAVILAVGSIAAYALFHSHTVADAELQAERVTRGILAAQADVLLAAGADGRLTLDVAPGDVERLDAVLGRLVGPFDIVKLKLYDSHALVVYSTDRSIIGVVDTANVRLARALTGVNDSKLESKDTVVDLEQETRFDRDVVETYVPIFNPQGEVVGSLEVYQDVTAALGTTWRVVAYTALILLGVIVAVFGISVAVIRRSAERLEAIQDGLAERVRTDFLTGLSSRGAIYERALEECDRMRRRSEKSLAPGLAVLLIDVDRFKAVNDEYGHEVGDEVLREVARRLGSAVRSYDLAGRYGGEEFLLLLPETSLEGALVSAERLRASVAGVSVSTSRGEIHVTVSIGVAVVPGGGRGIDVALRQADEALYQAKAAGRNKVTVFA